MSFRRPSLRREIVLGYSLILLVALSLFAGATYAILRRTLSNAGTQSLRQTAAVAERIVIPRGMPVVAVREELLPPEGTAVEVLRRTTQLPNGDELNVVVARTGDVEQHALRSFALIALMLIPVTAVLAAVAGRSMADRILQPLSRLVAASREIGIGGLSRRVDEPERPAELRELALAYNGMLERLERAVVTLRSFTADASHDSARAMLRTTAAEKKRRGVVMGIWIRRVAWGGEGRARRDYFRWRGGAQDLRTMRSPRITFFGRTKSLSLSFMSTHWAASAPISRSGCSRQKGTAELSSTTSSRRLLALAWRRASSRCTSTATMPAQRSDSRCSRSPR